MASATQLHYTTRDGAPPGQGRPPGVPGPVAAHSLLPYAGLHVSQSLTIFAPLPLYAISAPARRSAVITGLPPLPASPSAHPPAPRPAAQTWPGSPPKASPNPKASSAGQISSHIKAKDHTSIIHVVEEGWQPWRSQGMRFRWKPHRVDACLTVSDLITHLKAPGSCASDKGLVEMIEVGDGIWRRGTIWKKGDEKSKKMLREVGWTGKIKDKKPIWLAFWKEGGPN